MLSILFEMFGDFITLNKSQWTASAFCTQQKSLLNTQNCIHH